MLIYVNIEILILYSYQMNLQSNYSNNLLNYIILIILKLINNIAFRFYIKIFICTILYNSNFTM